MATAAGLTALETRIIAVQTDLKADISKLDNKMDRLSAKVVALDAKVDAKVGAYRRARIRGIEHHQLLSPSVFS